MPPAASPAACCTILPLLCTLKACTVRIWKQLLARKSKATLRLSMLTSKPLAEALQGFRGFPPVPTPLKQWHNGGKQARMKCNDAICFYSLVCSNMFKASSWRVVMHQQFTKQAMAVEFTILEIEYSCPSVRTRRNQRGSNLQTALVWIILDIFDFW